MAAPGAYRERLPIFPSILSISFGEAVAWGVCIFVDNLSASISGNNGVCACRSLRMNWGRSRGGRDSRAATELWRYGVHGCWLRWRGLVRAFCAVEQASRYYSMLSRACECIGSALNSFGRLREMSSLLPVGGHVDAKLSESRAPAFSESNNVQGAIARMVLLQARTAAESQKFAHWPRECIGVNPSSGGERRMD